MKLFFAFIASIYCSPYHDYFLSTGRGSYYDYYGPNVNQYYYNNYETQNPRFPSNGNTNGNSQTPESNGNGDLLPRIANWENLQLTTYLEKEDGDLLRLKTVEQVPDVLDSLEDSVKLTTASNGAFFNGSPNRPRTELTEKEPWDCTTTNKDMSFTMIIDELPNPDISYRVVVSQLYLILQVNAIVSDGILRLELELNGRWTGTGTGRIFNLSDRSQDMFGKQFTFSYFVSDAQIFYSYEDEFGRYIPREEITGFDIYQANQRNGACKFTVGNYLQTREDLRNMEPQYAVTRLLNLQIN